MSRKYTEFKLTKETQNDQLCAADESKPRCGRLRVDPMSAAFIVARCNTEQKSYTCHILLRSNLESGDH